MVWANASSSIWSPTVIEANGQVVSHVEYIVAVDPFSHEKTSWLPIWYLETALSKLGVQSTWNGRVWTMATPSSWRADVKNTIDKMPTASEMELVIDGKEVEIAPKLVAKDPWGHSETTYAPVYYVMEAVQAAGGEVAWNGEQLSLNAPNPTSSSNQSKSYTVSQMRFSSESAAVADIQKLEASYWGGTSQNPPVSIAPGVKAQFKGGAGQSAYEWNEGDWTFIVKLYSAPSTTQDTLKSIVMDIQDSALADVRTRGLVVITQNDESTNIFNVHAVWQKGTSVWQLNEKGVLLTVLRNIQQISP
ncbi:hypothetical protein TC41_2471 [Alicyclobacillus acidocaldarius subsp. acidocaldarius Tc-4-1]|uniref:Uncharacterized protein n=1 Tax=Alicyclobacillus acidocaldarius (strain Tc-4-1) TaxID=1048834 RepID=F8IH16_ALIAT|nr:hypothetical protein TC41_2471 [Alicyclobacillus acidocaldarius subsp. acidocaldarius Tc-4-1]